MPGWFESCHLDAKLSQPKQARLNSGWHLGIGRNAGTPAIGVTPFCQTEDRWGTLDK